MGILEKTDGSDTLNIGNLDFNLASVLMAEGHYDEALPYVQRSQDIYDSHYFGARAA